MQYYADYLAVEDWKVLDTKVCRFYDDEETKFGAVCVKIGVITSLDKSNRTIEKHDVIRWISNGEYLRLKKGSGVVVF